MHIRNIGWRRFQVNKRIGTFTESIILREFFSQFKLLHLLVKFFW